MVLCTLAFNETWLVERDADSELELEGFFYPMWEEKDTVFLEEASLGQSDGNSCLVHCLNSMPETNAQAQTHTLLGTLLGGL